MSALRQVPLAPGKAAPTKETVLDLTALSSQVNVSLSILRTFAAVSAPKNKNLFTSNAARKAFSGVKVSNRNI